MRGVSIVRAVVISGLAAGLVYGANQVDVRADWSRAGDDATSRVASTSLSTTLVCPGPDRTGTAGYETATQRVSVATALAPVSLLPSGSTSSASPGSVTASRLPGTAGGAPAPISTRNDLTRTDLAGAGSVRIVGDRGLSTGAAALQYATDDEPTVAGFAMTPCTQPVKDAWIPLGGNQPGRVARVVLSNPGSAPVTADVEVHGSSGIAAGKGANGVVVPPNDRVVVSLGDFGADLADAMVHVTATGGSIGVSGVDVLMQGETRAGEAMATPISASSDQVFAALPVVSGVPTVRVAVPGSTAATVRVRAIDSTGLVVADEVQDVNAGAAVSVVLQGVSPGTYAVRVTADQPVAAGALAVSAASGASDISWSAATPSVTGLTGSPLPSLPAGVRTSLVLFAADRQAAVEVLTSGSGGTTSRRTIPANQPVQVDVTGRDAVWVRVVSGSVNASLVTSGTAAGVPLLEVAGLPAVPVKSTVRDAAAERN